MKENHLDKRKLYRILEGVLEQQFYIGEDYIVDRIGTNKIRIKNADLIIIHTEWNEFKQLNFKKITKKRNFKVFDMRNLYSTSEMKKNKINYFSIGR